MSEWLMHLVIGVPGKPTWITYETRDLDLLVTAETEDEARGMVDKRDGQDKLFGIKHPWLSKEHSTCIEIGAK